MILSIDIGSTRTHIAAVDTRELKCTIRVDFENSEFDGGFGAALKQIANAHPQIHRANISSCVKGLLVKAKSFCVDSGMIDDAVIIQAHGELPVEFKYDYLQTLGADRVCNALACAALFKGENCIIIDSGTAITVDRLGGGGRRFEGGAILPGCAMQARALHGGTDALPEVDFSAQRTAHSAQRTVNTNIIINKNHLPAMSTAACITSGILYGTAGAVTRCVDECLCGGYSIDNTRIVATGGGWGIIQPLISRTVTTVPDLTLVGAGLF